MIPKFVNVMLKRLFNSSKRNSDRNLCRDIFNGHALVSYSQEGEDLVLSACLGETASREGFYVDVGAHDPIRFSNTNFFYRRGWRGISIDPNDGVDERFRSKRPDDCFVRAAISDVESEASFYVYNEPALNGIDNDRTEELAGTNYKLIRVDKLKTYPLAAIMDRHAPEKLPSPSFLSVDVEGLELKVINGHDWEKYPFDYLLIELRPERLQDIAEDEVHQRVRGLGYQSIACTGRTVVYKRLS